jgi:ElaB/YqjD/DUF883 family membrane-anchored ribosome-binding protein
MKRSKILSVLLIVLLIAAFVSCEQEGPAEKAGKKIDETMEKAGDKMEEAGEAVQEKTEEMKEKAKEAVQ